MKNRKIIMIIATAAVVSLTSLTFADPVIKLVLNGQELKTDVAPMPADNRVMVPMRVISEALGANIDWDAKTNSVIIDSTELEAQKMRINLLEQALEPKTQLDAINSYAEAVKMRNGAWQYAIMSPELKKENYEGFVSFNWVTGTSSPWIESYEIKEQYKSNRTFRYEVDFTCTDSTNSKFTQKVYVTMKEFDGTWLVSAIEGVDVKGKITKLTYEGKKLKSIFVEADKPQVGTYDKVTVLIGENTKIYKGYSDVELKPTDLKDEMQVEVDFVDGPMIMIYPPQAEAKTIRVIE
ncbi:hypothetical protein SDC9_128726 [bioreactor metagenome]|uniref:Copper amine oxidase-like N-terminal domain-containing protein n=1 Tax=bioreactor metagenome TaxID=1076179 RepID=A0A645CXN7_9ZZZZ